MTNEIKEFNKLIDKNIKNEDENNANSLLENKLLLKKNKSYFITINKIYKLFKDINNYNKSRNIYIALGILIYISGFFYKKSLEGGDLNFYTKNTLIIFSRYLSISFSCYNINLWLTAYLDISMKKKIFIYSFHIFYLIGLYIYDHGELLENHGLYNFMLFCMYTIIFNIITIFLYFWYKVSGKRFILQFSIFIFIFIFIEFINLRKYINIWEYGFLNKKIIDEENLCKIERPLPWFDLLPRGIKNFWTGSQSCSRKEHFEAFFDSYQNNKLVVNGCSENKITYMILPETFNLKYIEKDRWNLREVVVNKMNSKIYNYTEPIDLKNIEAVYVTCGNQSKLVTRIAGRRINPKLDKQPIEKLNVLMIFIDALSRRQFFRNLPKTAKKLEIIHKSGISHLNQFFRYGIVGKHTEANSLGLFVGLQMSNKRKGIPIWEEYRNRGYVVGIVDDQCQSWDVVYNYRTAISVDHELISPFCLPEYHETYKNPYSNFKGPWSIRRRCITGQYVHNYALNYTKEFINLYDGTNPWFFRSSYMEAHENTSEVLSLMDDDLLNFFESLSEETLNRTAIIIVSDHGLHMGINYLFTNQGHIEHKLPFLSTLIPERFLDKYPELRKNLDENEQKLISAFDIYTTLRDILDFNLLLEPKKKLHIGIDISKITKNNREKKINNKKKKKRNNKKRKNSIIWGKSLLRSIPNRTCQEILIPNEYCVCH